MRYIDEPIVASVLRMEELIPLMRQAMIDFSQGRIAQPPRRMLEVQGHGGFFASMPASSTNAMGAKLVTYYPGNAEKNLHTHMAVIVLFRPETGEPVVMMDGRLITEMRTSAVTATYVDVVAAPDVKTLAIFGAGTQGKSHSEALGHVRDFEEIRIWNRTRARAEQLAEAVGGKAMSCEKAVRDAEVVVVATSSAEPVLEGKWLRPGAKVATVGWGGADGGEVDAATMSHSIIVDSRAGALAAVWQRTTIQRRHLRRTWRGPRRHSASGSKGNSCLRFDRDGMPGHRGSNAGVQQNGCLTQFCLTSEPPDQPHGELCDAEPVKVDVAVLTFTADREEAVRVDVVAPQVEPHPKRIGEIVLDAAPKRYGSADGNLGSSLIACESAAFEPVAFEPVVCEVRALQG